MQVKLIRKAEQQESEWSGGTTCQLFIFPEDSNYEQRDFLFRISSAKVKTEESTFTKLPDISRIIMVLDGELKIEHEGKYSKTLKKFDTDTFEGNWNTKGFGICTDFNLMTSKNCNGNLNSVTLNSNQSFTKTLFAKENFVGYYLLNGEVEFLVSGKKYFLQQNDFILFSNENKMEVLNINSFKYSEMVEVDIYL
jgi:environmental stress-induced protein Ves